MKKLILAILLGVFMSGTASAQEREIFDNGVRWKAIHRDYTETVTLVIFVKGGIFRETPANNGIGALFARTWLKSGGLLEKTESVGGGVSVNLSSDYLDFSLSVPSEHLDDLLTELKRQLLSPVFSATVFEREKDLSLRELEADKDDPNSQAFQLFSQATYGAHPYSMRSEGEPDSVAALKLDDVKKYHAANMNGADIIAVMAGKFTPEQENEVKSILKAMPKGKPFIIDCAGSEIKKTGRVEATDNRIQQSKLFVAYTAPSADSKDYVYGKLMSDLLGGGMSSPYFTALRKEKGYAYSVGVMYPSRLCSSRMTGYIGLQQENVEDAITTMQSLNKSVLKNATSEDIEKSKNHIIGQVLSEAETNNRTAWYAAFFENLGLGFDHLERYIESIRKVKKADLEKIMPIFDGPYTVFVYKPAQTQAQESK